MSLINKWDDRFRWAMDTTDVSDFKYEDLAWNISNVILPDSIDLSLTLSQVQNQWAKSKTEMYCTAFTQSHWNDVLEVDMVEWFMNGEQIGDRMVQLNRLGPKWWAYIIDALKTNKELWFIDWYSLLKKTVAEFEHAIASGSPIATGTNRVNWRQTIANWNIVVKGSWYWHAFLIVWYDRTKRLFKVVNSYWPWFMEGGYFYLRYEDIWLLFNGNYALYTDSDEIRKLNEFKDVVESKKSELSKLEVYEYIINGNEEYESIVLLAMRIVYNMNITEDMLIPNK